MLFSFLNPDYIVRPTTSKRDFILKQLRKALNPKRESMKAQGVKRLLNESSTSSRGAASAWFQADAWKAMAVAATEFDVEKAGVFFRTQTGTPNRKLVTLGLRV